MKNAKISPSKMIHYTVIIIVAAPYLTIALAFVHSGIVQHNYDLSVG